MSAAREKHSALGLGPRCTGVSGSRKTDSVRDVEVRYAEHDGKCLAYEVFGEGPTDLLVHQICYPIDLTWDLPQLSDFMDSLGECARVIAFDSRGEGASDPIDDPGAATLEAWCDDVFAVLDAAGADRVTVFDMTTGVGGIDARGDVSRSGAVTDPDPSSDLESRVARHVGERSEAGVSSVLQRRELGSH